MQPRDHGWNVRFASTNSNRCKESSIFVLVIFVALCVELAFAEGTKQKCRGLHAGIHAQFVPSEPGVTHPAYVLLTFLLLNDAETSLDVNAESWTLVIDGIELKDSGMIFGNGPMPAEGYKSLKPGDHYEFGEGLELTRYFPHSGQYKVCWRGKNFESATVTINTP